MRRFKLAAVVAAVLFLCPLGAEVGAAQQPAPSEKPAVAARLAVSDTLWRVELIDGTTLIGRVVGTSADRVTLATVGQVQVEIRRDEVRKLSVARGRVVRGQFWPEDPNSSRLFLAPTARSIPAGEGYFGVFEVVAPFVGVGVTDGISLLIGSPFYIALAGVVPPIYVAPKLTVVEQEKLQAAVGFVTLLYADTRNEFAAGIVYGVGTYGSSDGSVTGGLGWGFVDGDLTTAPVVMLGGEYRLTRTAKLVTENWLSPGDGGVLSGGLRFMGDRLAVDIGLLTPTYEAMPFPIVNFVYAFGHR